MRQRLIFLVGGPDFHPVNEQAGAIIDFLGEEYACHTAESLAAFEHLQECDLLILMGMHWTGWEGRYRPPSDAHKRAFEKYIYSGRPLLTAHGGIASYDDWPRFGELVGFEWVWGSSSHSMIDEHLIQIRPSAHPIVEGISDFKIVDELYCDLQVARDMEVHVHADAAWNGRRCPMVLTADGGRIAGAGKTAYLANGHDMRAFESPELLQLWRNAVKWCLTEE